MNRTDSIKTAPSITKKLVRDLGYTRRLLWAASRKERDGASGASEEVDRICAKLCRDVQGAIDATDRAETVAADLDRASLILKTNTDIGCIGAMSALAAMAVRLGAPITPDLTSMAATRAAEAADKARTRLDDNWDDIRSAEVMADLSEAQRQSGFRDTPKTARLKALMNAHKEASKK
jgi:hypothetical protein